MTHPIIDQARAIASAAAGQVCNNDDAKCVETLVESLAISALAAAEERGRPQCKTIETAPKDGTRILLHPAVEVHDDWSKGHWSVDLRCWIVGGSPSGVDHTYWSTLPSAPAITKEPTP